jgi:hypothetical protein
VDVLAHDDVVELVVHDRRRRREATDPPTNLRAPVEVDDQVAVVDPNPALAVGDLQVVRVAVEAQLDVLLVDRVDLEPIRHDEGGCNVVLRRDHQAGVDAVERQEIARVLVHHEDAAFHVLHVMEVVALRHHPRGQVNLREDDRVRQAAAAGKVQHVVAALAPRELGIKATHLACAIR